MGLDAATRFDLQRILQKWADAAKAQGGTFTTLFPWNIACCSPLPSLQIRVTQWKGWQLYGKMAISKASGAGPSQNHEPTTGELNCLLWTVSSLRKATPPPTNADLMKFVINCPCTKFQMRSINMWQCWPLQVSHCLVGHLRAPEYVCSDGTFWRLSPVS